MRSKFEADVASDLAARGVSFQYEKRRMTYELPRTYIPDFELMNGIIIEAKGWFKPSDRTKMLEVKLAHPDADIRFVFQNPGLRIGGMKSATYAQWAERNGFPWAKGTVPAEWTTEKGKSDG